MRFYEVFELVFDDFLHHPVHMLIRPEKVSPGDFYAASRLLQRHALPELRLRSLDAVALLVFQVTRPEVFPHLRGDSDLLSLVMGVGVRRVADDHDRPRPRHEVVGGHHQVIPSRKERAVPSAGSPEAQGRPERRQPGGAPVEAASPEVLPDGLLYGAPYLHGKDAVLQPLKVCQVFLDHISERRYRHGLCFLSVDSLIYSFLCLHSRQMDIKRKIRDLAEADGFDRVNSLGQWNGWDLSVADTDEECAVGLPQYILSSEREARWATESETLEIMASLS